ncbi:hypothetical protein WA026_003095 [Henosepilachna vigintioctopunctata]|uniref:Uncharacterized protein n=1 Tax=Henosepilachna vigintioctopunctata TaxID=420089 RepID=A0AAW1TLB8_9CUCU
MKFIEQSSQADGHKQWCSGKIFSVETLNTVSMGGSGLSGTPPSSQRAVVRFGGPVAHGRDKIITGKRKNRRCNMFLCIRLLTNSNIMIKN